MDKNILLVCLAMIALVNAQNECSDTIYKPLGDLAKRSPTYFQDSVPLCDRYLAPGWYVALNYEMPTTAPGLWECGTTYPVWLSDTLPETQGSTKLAEVCEVDFSGSCSRNHTIQITNCGKFFVYKLTPLDRCSSAYCFKKDESCVSDVLSNISVAYHSVTWNTREEGITTYHDPEVNLVCQFDRLPDQSLYYDVTWYVDDTEVLRNQTVSSNSSDLALLTGSHLFANGKKANSMIHCIVGAKISETGTPCNTAGSSLFFAGIKVLNSTLRIPRGGRQDVMLQFTIPFINQNIVRQGATSTVQNPLYISLGVHGGSLTCDDKHKKACDYTVYAYEKQETYKYETDDWKVIHSIPIYNKDNGVYKINDKHITLRLETGFTESPGSKIFQYLSLPDIQVYIEDDDSAWKGAMCASHTDPHMMTFDKKRYECQLDGTYILYRNRRFEQEVQERHHMCHPDFSHPRCSCAVAVRSGKDVFMVDICNNQPIIHFPSCGDGVLKVIKINDKYFKVTLPTGTLVEIKFVQWPYLDDWQLNVEIFPSPSDIGTSRGLCGILDGDYINDFTRSDGTVDSPHLTYPDAFSESWRVKDNQLDLFDHQHYTNLISISEVFDYVCTCKTEYENGRLVKKNIECNYGTHQNCNFVFGKQYFCILNPEGQLRRKRDVRHLKSMFSNSQNGFGIDFDERRQKRENVLYIKTYEEAETICNTAFESSTSYRICREHVTDLSNTSLVNCISDVMMTGDDNFTRIHIEAALEQCSVFVVFNTTFQETEPDITYTIETFCQNNCSGHGICNAGNCTCENGYAGSDCSFDLLGPPTIFHMSDFGLCDKSKEACDEITLFGKYFIENMNTNCFMTRNTLNEEGTSISVVNYVIGLEERTLFEGYCPLEYDTSNNWVTEFSFNISNDGSRFTENFQVYTYQSFCQEFRNDTGNITFVFKDGYCFINNSCVSDGSTNTNNTCDICNTTKSKYEWSYNEGHCLISGVCYKSGENNGTNPCSICDPLLDKTVWSPNTEFCFIDGICYSNGQTQIQKNCLVCQTNSSRSDWTLKKDHCLINGLCFMNSQANESNSCQLCNTSQSNDSWTDNPDFCSINGECYQDSQTKVGKDCLVCQPNSTRTNWTLKNDYCFINEHCFMNSQSNESNYCQLCNTSRSNDSWTENPDFCSINGICYIESQTEVGQDCLVCQPNSTRTNWTLKKNHCLINELCFLSGQYNESNPCQRCNSSQSEDSWTENPDFCFINGTCYNDSQTQIGKDCHVCQPYSSRTNWTLKKDYCLINELCFMDNQSNESNPCQLCNTSQSKDTWTENPDFCSINGICYDESQTEVGKDCLVCQPNSTRTNWTLKKNYCLINELCYMDRQSNESNPCQLCNTSQSKELWTENPDYCSINGTCYSDGQTQVGKYCLVCQPNSTRINWTLKNDYCLINELCYMNSQSNESNPCQLCNTSQSKESWTENLDYCSINGTCYSDGQTQVGKDCLVCQPNSTRTNWILKNDYCLINELCLMNSQSNESNPCQLCNISQSKESWTENPDSCIINGTCYSNGQTQLGKYCLVCQPNSTKISWTLKNDHCLINELCLMNGQSNESNPCQLCNASQSADTWTENPDCLNVTSNGPSTASSSEPSTTTAEPTTSTPEHTTTTPEPATTTQELTTTAQKPTTTTPEPTTTTPEPTTTIPEHTTTTPEPTTTTQTPTTTTPEHTFTSLDPTTTTPKPTITTQEPTTTTSEPTTTTPEPTTTTLKPTTTTQEPTTSSLKPTTTTQEPTTTTSQPTTTSPEPTTTLEPTTSTLEPTTSAIETTTTPEPTTTTPKPTTTTQGSTTTTPQPTTTTPEPTTSTEHTTTTPELSTTTPEPITITSVPLTTEHPNCMKSPEDVSVEYHSVSWFSTNETNTTTIRTVHQPYINFKCMFVLLQDASVFYKIEWYINNATLIKTVTVSEADIGQATLSSNDLPPLNQTAGLQIQCTVSVRKDLAPSNCKRKTSPVFFAGIKVNQAYHDILRKGKTFVMLYMTIPYVTKTVVVNGQVQPLPALAIYPHLPQSTSSCRGSIGVDKCVIEFKAFSFNERQMYDSDDWRQNQTLVLNHVDTNGYEIDQSMTIQLKTRSDGNTFWNNFNQNISMTITDYNEYWKGTSCGSKTDPHMYTFDGVSYENHIEGEFILYRNMLYNQEVQTKHKQCHPDYNFPHCTCAVSVQSGQDVFIVDLCGDIQFVDFLSCNDSVIQVYKISDKLYKISLPTGTYVMVSLVEWPVQGSWQIDIDIYPSLSDVNNTVGLCGTLDRDRDNDFKRRNGDTDNVNLVYPDEFSNSWKVLDNENLLKEPLSTRQPISSTLDKICMCTSNGDQCSYNTLTHCSTTVEKQFQCTELTVQTSVSRKKRALSRKWIPPSLSVPKPLTRNKRDVQFNISTSRENAESVCTLAFESSDPYKTCQDYVSDLSNSSLSNCINDVIMTGDYNITAIHVEAALQQCVTFVGLNTTLQNANRVVTTSLQSLCPSNCSGHGVCNKGNCSCEVGFGGSDCSFDILSPPVIWESTPSAICDKSLHQCSRVYLKGRYFLENVDKNCFFNKQSIHHDGSVLALSQLESSLEEENLFRGSCSIPSNDVTSWVTKYMFNVSYDRKHFTQSFSFYTYQSECQQHSVEKGLDQFTLKKEYCFINNTCVQLAAINPENRCQVCYPDRNNYQWSGIQDCESTTTPEPSALSTSTIVYIVTASVLGFIFVVAIVVVIGVWKYRRSRQYAESSEDENTDYRRDVVSKSWMRFFDDGKFPYIPRGSRYSTQTYPSPKTERFY